MDRVIFHVQGSAPEPYEVTFSKSERNLTARCTCPAGQVGQYCKHRFAILGGETAGIVSGNAGEVSQVRSWLPGTDVEEAMQELLVAEAAVEDAKRRASIAKKKLARVLSD